MAFSTHDIVPDSPTNNFATWNPLSNSQGASLSEGNLKAIGVVTDKILYCTHGMSSGKWYWEVNLATVGNRNQLGVFTTNGDTVTTTYPDNYAYIQVGNNSSSTSATNNYTTPSFSAGDIVTFVFDADIGAIWYGKNAAPTVSGSGHHYGLPTSVTYAVGYREPGGTVATNYINFGQDPTFGGASNLPTGAGDYDTDAAGNSTGGRFAFQPPTGAKALCTANLRDFTPTVTGDTPQDYFKTVIWTGQTNAGAYNNGNVTVGFQPDLVWIKMRNNSAANANQSTSHVLSDSVRGILNFLITNSTNDEYTSADGYTNTSNLTSYNPDGFSVGTELNFNGNGDTYVAWCWKSGGSPSATDDGTGVSGSAKLVNTSGAASSTTCKSFKDAAVTAGASNVICPSKMSINQAAGFSIVKYTGTGANATVPHGLSSAPEFIIIKSLSEGTTKYTGQWDVYHKSLGVNKLIALNIADKFTSPTNVWTATPDSNVITMGNAGAINYLDDNYIAYCWHSVGGYSKFGSYTGNGSADGPFVYTGFRPAFVICKCSSDTTTTNTSWAMYDNARDSSNVMNKVLYANETINEGYRGDASTAATDIYIDFLSNGFKVRSTKEEVNDSGETYIFMAFAEQPFKFSNAR